MRRTVQPPTVLSSAALALGVVVCLGVLALTPSLARADAWEVSATLDKARISKNDVLTYRVVAVGPGNQGPELTSAPAFTDFRVLDEARTTSLINTSGRVVQSHTFIFRLSPQRSGVLSIGPASVTIAGQRYRTQTLTVDVTGTTFGGRVPKLPSARRRARTMGGSGTTQPRTPGPGRSPVVPGVPVPQAPLPLVPVPGDDYFLEVEVGSHEVFLGEPFLVHYDLYRQKHIVPDWYEVQEPEFTGFWPHDTTDSYLLTTQSATRAGKRYAIEPVRAYMLAPIETGTLTIPSVQVEVPSTTGSFATTKHWIGSPSVEINVLPLPPTDRPGFDVANVGRTIALEGTIRASEDRPLDGLRIGDSVIISATLRGEGMIDQMRLAPFAAVDGFLVYGPEVEEVEMTRTAERLAGKKRFRVTLVPTREGALEVPPVRFLYFDVDTASYRERSLADWRVVVSGKAPNADDVIAQAKADDDATDPRHEVSWLTSETGLRTVSTYTPASTPPYRRVWFQALLAMPVLVFVALMGLGAVRRRREDSAPMRRAGAALQRARATLRRAGKLSDPAIAWRDVRGALGGFLDDRFAIKLGSLTGTRLVTALCATGVDETLAERVRTVVQAAEAARFGGRGTPAQADAIPDIADLVELFEALEKIAISKRGSP